MGRTARIAIAVLIVSLTAMTAAQAGARPAYDPATAQASALKKCKKGLNKKRCACPKGQKLAKKGKRFRCRKVATKQPAGTTPGTTAPGTTTPANPDPGTTTPDPGAGAPAPAAPTQPAPDSKETFTGFMKGSALTDEGYDSTQTFRHKYVYTFCQDGTYKYYSENLSFSQFGSSSTSSQGAGTWQVTEAAVSGDKTQAQGRMQITWTAFQTDGAPANPGSTPSNFIVTLVSRPTYVQAWVGETEVQRGSAGC
jgi:hypothetical protein